MWHRRRLIARMLLAAVGLGLLGSVAVFGVPQLHQGFRERLQLAQQRWGTRAFANYRIVIEDDSGRCRQDALVAGDEVIKRIGNTCRIPPRAVSNLFRLLEGTPPSRYRCVEHGCICDTVMSVVADYDPALGYPHQMRFLWQARTNWHHLDYWNYLWANGSLPSCRATTFSRTITVVSLTPITLEDFVIDQALPMSQKSK